MLSVNALSRHFGELKAVDDLSFSVEGGEIFGLLGPNGAGKTTTIKMIIGMLEPTDGTVSVCGYDVLREPIEVKKRIGYVPETCSLYENLSGREYLELIGNLHHLPADRIESQIEKLTPTLGLSEAIDHRIITYSKGMKQKVLLSSALLHNPEVIIMDEPFSGLDSNSAAIFKQVIGRLADSGKAVIFSSHVLEVVEKLCGRLLIIHRGRMLAEGTVKEIMAKAGETSLVDSFSRLTGITDVGEIADDILNALK